MATPTPARRAVKAERRRVDFSVDSLSTGITIIQESKGAPRAANSAGGEVLRGKQSCKVKGDFVASFSGYDW